MNLPAHMGQAHIYIPHKTSRALFGEEIVKREAGQFSRSKVEIGQIIVRVLSEDTLNSTYQVISEALKRNHINEDYNISVPLHLLRSKQRTQRILNLVLIAISALSLLVGGIGIMNIMLANVTERIPEIGIRMALGATRQDIVLQFLFETITLSLIGGALGCLLGFVSVPLISSVTGWEGVITPKSILLSLGVSMSIGLVFGTAPALQASRLDPGVALRG